MATMFLNICGYFLASTKSGYSLAPYFAQMIAEHLCGKIDVFTHKLFSDCVLDKP